MATGWGIEGGASFDVIGAGADLPGAEIAGFDAAGDFEPA